MTIVDFYNRAYTDFPKQASHIDVRLRWKFSFYIIAFPFRSQICWSLSKDSKQWPSVSLSFNTWSIHECKRSAQYRKISQASYLFYSESRPSTENTTMHTRLASIPPSLTISQMLIILRIWRPRRALVTIVHSFTLSDFLSSMGKKTFCATKI